MNLHGSGTAAEVNGCDMGLQKLIGPHFIGTVPKKGKQIRAGGMKEPRLHVTLYLFQDEPVQLRKGNKMADLT